MKRAYAKNCILARRLIECGARVVQLFNGADAQGNGISNWDSHANIDQTHAMQAGAGRTGSGRSPFAKAEDVARRM